MQNKYLNRLSVISCITLVTMILAGCQDPELNVEYNKAKQSFLNAYTIDSIFNHFPVRIKNSALFSGFFAPPDSGDCFGEMFLGIKMNNEKLQTFMKQKVLLSDPVNSKKYFLLKNVTNRFFYAKNRIDTSFLFPIANLHLNDFHLGEIPDSIYLEDFKKYITLPCYKTPPDLIVNLIDAQFGDFWKNKCDRFRPEQLGRWLHGYSRGYAISVKEGIVIYWVVTW